MRYQNVLTTCIYCGAGCGVYLQVLDGEIVGVLPDKEHPVSRGSLCIKGRFGYDFVAHPDRLSAPLIRKNGTLVKASWEEAIELVSEKMSAIKEQHGSDAIAGLASARCTNEENYLFQKFFRSVLGTNNVDHCARL